MTVCEGDGSRNVTTWKYLMWLFKAHINIFFLWKYAKACISWLLPSACLHIRYRNMWFGRGQQEKLEQTCLMIWSCNIPLSTHFKITEMGNYKIGNSKSNVNEDYISTAPIFRIFTIFSHDWLHSFNISTYVTVDAQSRLSWPSTSACSSNLVPRAFSLAWRRGGKKG